MTDKTNETETREFDLAELVKGSVDSVTEKLGQLSDGELQSLHKLESDGAKRVTLTDAIHREMKARSDKAEAEGERAQDEAAVAEAEARFTQADIDKAVAEAKAGTIPASEHGRLMTEKDTAHANALAAAKAAAAGKAAPKPKPEPGAKHVTIDAKAEAPGLVALTGATKVQFVDDRDMSLPKLPVLEFVPAQFAPVGEAVKLTEDVTFPTTLAGAEVAGAFLMDDGGKVVAKASLVTPVKVGGGRNVKLPGGTLMFEKPAAKAA